MNITSRGTVRNVVLGAVACALASAGGAGIVWSQAERTVATDADDIGAEAPFEERLTDEELAVTTSGLDEERQQALAQILGDMASDRHPVLDRQGEVRGFISNDAFFNAELPTSSADLYEVVSDTGALVGYWGGGVGFVERAVVEAPGFDVAQYIQSVLPGQGVGEGRDQVPAEG